MKFLFSDQLSADENSTGGIAGVVPLRKHRTPLGEDVGALRAQRDWERYIGPLSGFRGGLFHEYGLMQVAVPECRPERLEIISYANEIGFLYDDCTEFLGANELNKANDRMQSAFVDFVRGNETGTEAVGSKAIQAILTKEMISIDRDRALTAIKVWIEFLKEAAGRKHNAVYTTLEEYLKYRVLDAGEMFWFGLATFGMALTIPESEMSLIRQLSRPCWIVLALQNDFCSNQKEVRAAHSRGVSRIVNALMALMDEHGVNLEEARRLCREQIGRSVVEYQNNLAHSREEDISQDARTYLESLLYTISGDAAWSLITPRYNQDHACHEFHQNMTTKGVEVDFDHLQTESIVSSLSEKGVVECTVEVDSSVI